MSETAEQSTLEERIEALVTQIASSMGLEVYLCEIRPRQDGLIRALIDRPGAGAPGTGVTIGELARVTREMESVFDTTGMIPFAYRLEVSSPGVERELTLDRHFEAFRGHRVRVTLRAPDAAGRAVFEGELGASSPTHIEVIEPAGPVLLVRGQIRRAKTLFDFSTPKPAGPARKVQGGRAPAKPTNKPRKKR